MNIALDYGIVLYMESTDKKKIVSFSQFQNWFNCPHRWWLDHVKGLRIRDNTINTCFGTAIHEPVQEYIKTLYTVNAPAADSLNLNKMFKEAFDRELEKNKVERTDDEYTNFVFDGQDIIREFCKTSNRVKHFPTGKYEFLGVELKIMQPIRNNLEFMALIDLALKNKKTGRIKIIDIKTSSLGWNRYQKEDESKYSQVLLYKALYSKKYEVPLSHIDVEFFILKRKLMENVSFPQSRIQTFIPQNTSGAVNKSIRKFTSFVDECFTLEGTYNTNRESYPKIPGKAKKNCKYCNHKKVNCDAKSDLKEEDN